MGKSKTRLVVGLSLCTERYLCSVSCTKCAFGKIGRMLRPPALKDSPKCLVLHLMQAASEGKSGIFEGPHFRTHCSGGHAMYHVNSRCHMMAIPKRKLTISSIQRTVWSSEAEIGHLRSANHDMSFALKVVPQGDAVLHSQVVGCVK